MKEIIESVKIFLPESSIRISKILQQLQDEVEFVIESFEKDGYLPDNLININLEIENILEDMKIGYGQLNLLEGIDYTLEDDSQINYKDFRLDPTIAHSLMENLTHTRPYGFEFLTDKVIEANTWKELYIKACEIFIQIDEKKFLSFINKTYMNGESRDYFGKTDENIDLPIKIMDKVYISTKFSANEIRNMLIKILKEYNFDVNGFIIYLRADYKLLHK